MLGEEREVVAHDAQALLVVGDFEIGDTRDLGVHRGATHLLLGHVLAHRGLDEMPAAERHRRRALHHRHEVGEPGDIRGARRAVTEHRRDHRDDTAHRHLLAEERARAREARAARRLDARAGGIEQPDERDALAHRVRAHAGDLVLPDGPHRAGHHGEVVGRDRNGPAVDLTDTGDHAVGGEEPVAEACVHVIGEEAVLDPGPRIDEEIESLAHGQLAQRALTLDELLAAHLERAGLAGREVTDERTPVVTRVGHRYRPFHCGRRFSAKAATPSAASSVCEVTVNMLCRYVERGVGVHLEHPVERVRDPSA